MIRLYKSIFFTPRFFLICGLLVLLCILAWRWPFLNGAAWICALGLPCVLIVVLTYKVRPVRRGEYTFGAVNILCATVLGLIQRKYTFDEDIDVPVYPSYIQMRKYELLAISHRLVDAGIK